MHQPSQTFMQQPGTTFMQQSGKTFIQQLGPNYMSSSGPNYMAQQGPTYMCPPAPTYMCPPASTYMPQQGPSFISQHGTASYLTLVKCTWILLHTLLPEWWPILRCSKATMGINHKPIHLVKKEKPRILTMINWKERSESYVFLSSYL